MSSRVNKYSARLEIVLRDMQARFKVGDGLGYKQQLGIGQRRQEARLKTREKASVGKKQGVRLGKRDSVRQKLGVRDSLVYKQGF